MVITQGISSLEESLGTSKLNYLESLESALMFLYFPHSEGPLKSLESLTKSLESLDNGHF